MEEDERYREKMNEDENAGKCCEMLEEGEWWWFMTIEGNGYNDIMMIGVAW
jgi:hypothetical protein